MVQVFVLQFSAVEQPVRYEVATKKDMQAIVSAASQALQIACHSQICIQKKWLFNDEKVRKDSSAAVRRTIGFMSMWQRGIDFVFVNRER